MHFFPGRQLTELGITMKQVNHTFVLCGFSPTIGAGSGVSSGTVALVAS